MQASGHRQMEGMIGFIRSAIIAKPVVINLINASFRHNVMADALWLRITLLARRAANIPLPTSARKWRE